MRQHWTDPAAIEAVIPHRYGMLDAMPLAEEPGALCWRCGRSAHQYSSASIMVITRSVTDGSAGSDEWYIRLLSK